MMVMGIMTYPTAARVAEPVSRLASGERTGRAEEPVFLLTRVAVESGRSLLFAMEERTVFSAEK